MRLRVAFEWLLAAFVGLVALIFGIRGFGRSRGRLGASQHLVRLWEQRDEDDDREFVRAPSLDESSAARALYSMPAERVFEPHEAPRLAEHDRAVRYEARVQLLVTDVDAVATRIQEFVASAGGYTVDAAVSSGTFSPSGRVTVAVPAAQLFPFLDQLASLPGVREVEERSLRRQDVTGEAIDIGARLRAARTAEQRYLSLVERAERVQDVLRVEEELRRIRAEIERLESQQRFLQERVSYAVVTVALRSARSLGERMRRAFRAGWDRGIGLMVDLASLSGRLAALASVVVPAVVVFGGFLRWLVSHLVIMRQAESSDRMGEQSRE
ncbi:DUF4349 domain-containing protein [Thermomicrobium sp.]